LTEFTFWTLEPRYCGHVDIIVKAFTHLRFDLGILEVHNSHVCGKNRKHGYAHGDNMAVYGECEVVFLEK
jgi:hypothetical protein